MSPVIVIVALVAVVVWGASPVATKLAVSELAPLSVAMLRTLIGGAASVVLALALGLRLPQEGRLKALLLLSSLCGFIGFPLLFSVGVKQTSANHASMILAMLPLFTGAIAMAWDRRWPATVWWIGCAIALAGEALLILSRGSDSGEATLSGDLIVLGGNLFASLGYVAGARLQRDGYPSTGTTFWGAALAAALLVPFSPFLLSVSEMSVAGTGAWGGVLYLAVGVTIIGYVMWYWALGKGGIERIGLIQFLQPVSGVALAWLLLHEGLSWSFAVASLLILLGVWVAVRAK